MADDRGLVFVNYNDPPRRLAKENTGGLSALTSASTTATGPSLFRNLKSIELNNGNIKVSQLCRRRIMVLRFEIDPQINNILTFYRDSAIAGMSAVSRRGWTFWQISAVSTRDAFDVLNDPDTARGFLERAANMASLLRPSLRSRAPALLGDTLRSLKRDLDINTGHGHVVGPRTQSRPVAIYRQIMVLVSCATLVGDWGAAHPHGVMLRSMIQAQSPLGKVDFGMLHHVLFMDAHYAANFLVQPLFDMEHWYREEFELGCPSPLPVPGISEWPDRHEGNGDWSWNVNLLGPIDAESSLHDIPLVTRSVLLIGAAGAMEEVSGSDSYQSLFRQCCLLSALYWLRALRFQFRSAPFDFYDAVPQTLRKCKAALTWLEDGKHSCHGFIMSTFTFWILVSDAQAERVQACGQQQQQQHGWYTVKLSEQARIMNVLDWQSARDVLRTLVYSDLLQPSGDV
ncbi:hypothetical protein LTR43_008488 [Exophiala xenobiotica]|nr:hypothetical protein LTS06_003071 [Exophiala xenobiotica]